MVAAVTAIAVVAAGAAHIAAVVAADGEFVFAVSLSYDHCPLRLLTPSTAIAGAAARCCCFDAAACRYCFFAVATASCYHCRCCCYHCCPQP